RGVAAGGRQTLTVDAGEGRYSGGRVTLKQCGGQVGGKKSLASIDHLHADEALAQGGRGRNGHRELGWQTPCGGNERTGVDGTGCGRHEEVHLRASGKVQTGDVEVASG